MRKTRPAKGDCAMKIVTGLSKVAGMFRCNKGGSRGKAYQNGTWIPTMRDLARAANAYSKRRKSDE